MKKRTRTIKKAASSTSTMVVAAAETAGRAAGRAVKATMSAVENVIAKATDKPARKRKGAKTAKRGKKTAGKKR